MEVVLEQRFDFSPLNNGVMEITFTKANGDTRVMRCTKDFRFIPENKHPKTVNETFSTDVAKVFDLDKQDWRSFKYDSVIDAKVVYDD